jgi:hypothetical protein
MKVSMPSSHPEGRRSSVVEHTLGKGEVESPILSDGTSLRVYFVILGLEMLVFQRKTLVFLCQE